METTNTNQVPEPAQVATPATVPTAPVTSPVVKKFYQKKAFKIIAIIAIIIIALVAIVNQATSGATKASNQFLNAVQSNQSNVAYELFSSEVKDNVTKDDFKEVVSQIGPILNTDEKMTGKSVEAETGKPSTGQVLYEIKGTDGKTYEIAIDLVKEDGDWKVENFDSDEK
ncbi:hypothetical protein KBB49_00035 [Candidatus Saccharibacteria bacterium]|nr:hypothetical protein [Candidatus Saccharibacteria bacterium]